MIRFAYPNVDGSYCFIGCGRYAVFSENEQPGNGYAIVRRPNTSDIEEIRETALQLAPTHETLRRFIYEIKDRVEQPYQGASLDLAYLLALIHCSLPSNFPESSQDIWCTGRISHHENRPILKSVDQEMFDIKLKAFLTAENPDRVFIVPEANFDHHVSLALDRYADVTAFFLHELSAELLFERKIIVKVRRDELALLRDVLFESPAIGVKAASSVHQNPYRGLSSFREEDAELFFGRETYTEQLFEAVQHKPFAAVLGASGSGKSSVVYAGLLPRLAEQEQWLIKSFRPGPDPFLALSSVLVDLLTPELDEIDRLVQIKKLRNQFTQRELSLSDILNRIRNSTPHARILLFADQFEELYTLCSYESERRCFLDEIFQNLELFRSSGITFVLTMRADFLHKALEYRSFADILQDSDIKLGSMKTEELRDVIACPAQHCGVQFEAGLIERILDAVKDEPGQLPLLEFALTELWKHRDGRLLAHAAYDDIGGVEQALSSYAESVYHSFNSSERTRLQSIFTQLVRAAQDMDYVRRIATRSEIGEENWKLVIQLADKRLVVTDRNLDTARSNVQQKETVEIVHESLIQGWQRLRGWMDDDRDFRAWQEQLRVVMQLNRSAKKRLFFTRHKYDKSLILRENILKEAKTWLTHRKDSVGAEERGFIEFCERMSTREKMSSWFFISPVIGVGLFVILAIIGVYIYLNFFL